MKENWNNKEVVEMFKEFERRFMSQVDCAGFGNEPIKTLTYKPSIKERFLKEKGLLEEELEKGVWYRIVGNTCGFDYSKFLICYTQKDNNYGFNANGEWSIHLGTAHAKYYHKATKEEIEPLLIAEAKRRGLVEGVKYISLYDTYENTVGKDLIYSSSNCLTSNTCSLFDEGKWATPIESEEMTLEAVCKELKRNIKIVK